MYTKIEQEIFNERIPKIFFGICLERKEYHRGAYSMEATGAEKGMFSEEEQFYAYTEQSEESEVSTAGKVMWKTNIISVRKKTSDIHLPFVSCNEDIQDVSINIELGE